MSEQVKLIDSHWPHRVGCLLVCVVFPLIWIGNLVTTADAGMAVPDWPNTYGYNLFSYPYREWFFGPWDLFVEHGHRLLASLAGMISIVLVIVTRRMERRRWVQMYALLILLLVIFQGVLGGVRVLLDERSVAKIHGCVGPLFFATAVGFCVVTSQWWHQSKQTMSKSDCGLFVRLIPNMAVGMMLISFCQLALGAFIRHVGDDASPHQFALLVACHVLTAIAIVLGTVFQFGLTRRQALKGQGVRSSINLLLLLVALQFCLGICAWVFKFGWPVWFENFEWAATFVVPEKSFNQINLVTAHAAIGSLILAFWTTHALRCCRAINSNRPANAMT